MNFNKKKQTRTDHAILSSLVNLASSFANQDAVSRVTAMFEEIKNNLLASLVKINQEEDDSVAAYEQDVANVKIFVFLLKKRLTWTSKTLLPLWTLLKQTWKTPTIPLKKPKTLLNKEKPTKPDSKPKSKPKILNTKRTPESIKICVPNSTKKLLLAN